MTNTLTEQKIREIVREEIKAAQDKRDRISNELSTYFSTCDKIVSKYSVWSPDEREKARAELQAFHDQWSSDHPEYFLQPIDA